RMKKKIALPWGRLGLRGRLFAAFGAVAALTVLASANALISYDGLGRSLGVVTGTSLPQVTRAARIAKEAAEVIAAAQALLAADAGERERALRALETERGDLVQAVNALPAEDAAKLKETAARMSENLDRLARAAADLPLRERLPPIKERFTAAAGHLEWAAAELKNAEITKLAAELISVGRRDGNIFDLKEKEFAGAAAGANVVKENRALAAELDQ